MSKCELKPCPFCGGEAAHGAEVVRAESDCNATVVYCVAMCWGKCRARMSFKYSASKEVKDPIKTGMRMIAKQWNRRANV